MRVEAASRRQRTIQIVLVIICLATLPCYCVGFGLLALAPHNGRSTPTPQTLPQSGATNTLALPSLRPTITFIIGTNIPGPLQPTPTQINLPIGTIAPIPTWTPVFFPTWTPFVFPTWTPFVFPTNTP
ncbi:MAG: hypothetical protein IAE83_11025, partial [Anaerolinea sp.]|nr:hypothetical protein [Anaerolinea sp.]